MWTTLNFRVRVKTKTKVRDICERTLDIYFKGDWWVGLGPALGDGKNLKYVFPVSGIFPGKANSVILLGFECTINPQNRWSHFWENQHFLFLSYVNYP